MRTIGISPKVIADLLLTVATFIVAYLPLGIDPVVAAAVAKGLGALAAVIAPPGVVVPAGDGVNPTAGLEAPR